MSEAETKLLFATIRDDIRNHRTASATVHLDQLEAVLVPTEVAGGAQPRWTGIDLASGPDRTFITCPHCKNSFELPMAAAPPQQAGTAQLATWMMSHSFATGHGDSFEDLLEELDWQVEELRQKAAPATARLSADEIASLLDQHTTNYASRADQGWDWSCDCGEKGYSADWEFCMRLTRGHHANVIANALLRSQQEGK